MSPLKLSFICYAFAAATYYLYTITPAASQSASSTTYKDLIVFLLSSIGSFYVAKHFATATYISECDKIAKRATEKMLLLSRNLHDTIAYMTESPTSGATTGNQTDMERLRERQSASVAMIGMTARFSDTLRLDWTSIVSPKTAHEIEEQFASFSQYLEDLDSYNRLSSGAKLKSGTQNSETIEAQKLLSKIESSRKTIPYVATRRIFDSPKGVAIDEKLVSDIFETEKECTIVKDSRRENFTVKTPLTSIDSSPSNST